jgi:proline dehydrogenase
MSLSRRLLLRASRSAWLADQLRQRAFFRRAVRRFLPGEDLDAALAAAAEFARAGMGSVLTQLGEQVTTRADAVAVRDHYLRVLGQVRGAGRRLPVQLSIKLTHLGLDVDRAACEQALDALVARAAQSGSFIWIDMEESRYVDVTLDLFRGARAEHDNVGVCLQSYLRRTSDDLVGLLPLGPAIRLVKGAYNEPASIAFPRKRDVDACYATLADRLLQEAARGRGRPVFGTHDLPLIAGIRQRAARHGTPPNAYEIHMLYGIQSAAQRALAAEGCVVRVLISYGTAWFAWYMRRLAERPANLWFVVKNLV